MSAVRSYICPKGDDRAGYLRTYSDGGELRDFHLELEPQPADLERCALVKQRDAVVEAERSLRTMRFAVAGIDIADYVSTWLDREIREVQRDLITIRRAMHFTWDRLDMAPEVK